MRQRCFSFSDDMDADGTKTQPSASQSRKASENTPPPEHLMMPASTFAPMLPLKLFERAEQDPSYNPFLDGANDEPRDFSSMCTQDDLLKVAEASNPPQYCANREKYVDSPNVRLSKRGCSQDSLRQVTRKGDTKGRASQISGEAFMFATEAAKYLPD